MRSLTSFSPGQFISIRGDIYRFRSLVVPRQPRPDHSYDLQFSAVRHRRVLILTPGEVYALHAAGDIFLMEGSDAQPPAI